MRAFVSYISSFRLYAVAALIVLPLSLCAASKKKPKVNKKHVALWEEVRTQMVKENGDSTELLCCRLINELGVKNRYDSLGELAHRVLGEMSFGRHPMGIYQAYTYFKNYPVDGPRKRYAETMERRLRDNYRETIPVLKRELGLQGVYVADLHTEGFGNNRLSGIAKSNSQKMPLLMLNLQNDRDTLKMQMMPPCLFADKLGAYNWHGARKNLYSSPVVVNVNDSTGRYFASISNQKINNPHTSTANFLADVGAQVGATTLKAVTEATLEQGAAVGVVGAGISILFQLGSIFASSGGVENGIIAVEFWPETEDVMFADITFATLSVDESNNRTINEEKYRCRLYRIFSDSEAGFINVNNGCVATCEYFFNPLSSDGEAYQNNFSNMHPLSYPVYDMTGKEVKDISLNEYSMANVLSKSWPLRTMADDRVLKKMPPAYRLKTFNTVSGQNEIGTIIGDYDKKIKGFKTFMARLDYDGQLILSSMSDGVKDGEETVYMPDGSVVLNEYRNGVVKQTERIR